MNTFLSLGRWIFPLPFAIFGLFHFMDSQVMADLVVPTYLPAKTVWVYIAGAGLIAASVSMILGKYDKLAATLLACFLLLIIFTVHAPNAAGHTLSSQTSLSSLLKDLALAGAAMLYAAHLAKDPAIIG
jgi:putative oxidoreductase